MKRAPLLVRAFYGLAAPILLLAGGGLVDTAQSQTSTTPPFYPGQVVVSGNPDDLPKEYIVIKYLPHANLSIVSILPGRERGHIRSLRAKGYRANLNLKAQAFSPPNDPLYSFQWHFPLVQSEQAWTLSDGSGVTVAVLDTGLAVGGQDGIGCVTAGIDVVNGDNDPADGHGHGTHVSGTIAQTTSNGTGVAGLAHGACIMPVKVLNDNGSGPFADIADGIYYAVDNGAEVINMSLGVNARFNLRNDPVMDPALDYAHAQGVTVVCASGNHGSHKNVSYPAIYPTTISVGATDALSEVTRYSNRGDGLDLVAPGGDMTKDRNGDGYVDGVFQETRSNGSWAYYFFEGTSMASPHVASAAAMLYAYGTATDALGVHEALTSTALDLDEPGYDSTSGFGLLQIYGALLYGGCLDLDSDGYSTCEGDCNDSDATIYPGAEELCGDGLDDNCDGTIDEGCVSCIDADDDGWCVDQGDCDDGNRRVYPGHGDTKGKWGRNGVDNDCNGIIDG